jgi:hypothetical protein
VQGKCRSHVAEHHLAPGKLVVEPGPHARPVGVCLNGPLRDFNRLRTTTDGAQPFHVSVEDHLRIRCERARLRDQALGTLQLAEGAPTIINRIARKVIDNVRHGVDRIGVQREGSLQQRQHLPIAFRSRRQVLD